MIRQLIVNNVLHRPIRTIVSVFDPRAELPEEQRSLAWYLDALDRRGPEQAAHPQSRAQRDDDAEGEHGAQGPARSSGGRRHGDGRRVQDRGAYEDGAATSALDVLNLVPGVAGRAETKVTGSPDLHRHGSSRGLRPPRPSLSAKHGPAPLAVVA